MTLALIDDQLLGAVHRGATPPTLRGAELYTTGNWYVRLCQAVLGAAQRPGVLSGPFLDLPDDLRERAVAAVIELPEEIGLVSLRQLGPSIGHLRRRYELNILSVEALAAARHLEADVYLSVSSPRLEAALSQEAVNVHVRRS